MSSAHHSNSLPFTPYLWKDEHINHIQSKQASKYVTKSWEIRIQHFVASGLPSSSSKNSILSYQSFRNLLLAVARNSLGFAPNVLLTPENSRDSMQVPARAWAVDGEERERKARDFFCRETDLNYDLVSCEGYLKNGALASLGLGRGSGAYYGSVENIMSAGFPCNVL